MIWRVLTILFLFTIFLYGPQAVNSYVENKNKPKFFVPIELNADKLFSEINIWRTEVGKKPYTKLDSLCEIANKRVKQIVNNFTHSQFSKLEYPSTLSENLAKNPNGEEKTIDMWLNSKSHREALESNYTYSCIATEGTYAVQIFSSCENGCP